MSFEDWKNQTASMTVEQPIGFEKWKSESAQLQMTPDETKKQAEGIYDLSTQSSLPLNEAENLFTKMNPPSQKPDAETDGLVKRFGKQLYNDAIAKTLSETLYTLGGGKVTSYLMAYLVNKKLESKGVTPPSLWEMQKQVKAGTIENLEKITHVKSAEVAPPAGVPDKIIDAAAGVAAFTAQVLILKKAAPSMAEWKVWETVNLANGGIPGGGAAMQLTLGGIGKIVPGTGILPATGRAAITSTLFGTTTYLGGGDTEDILINMGIPVAFEGLGVGRNAWMNYKGKTGFIKTLKEKAPALKNRPDLEVEEAIGKVLPVEPEPKPAEGKTTETKPKTEIKVEAKVPEPERRLTPEEQIKENVPIIENDINAKVAISSGDAAKARERGFITSVKEVLPELKIEGQYIPRSTDVLSIKARNLIVDNLAQAEQVAAKGSSDTAVAVASELIKYYGEQADTATTQVAKDLWYEKAANVANNMAEKLTELGRAVQAASILGRLTPEGQVRFAAREIQRYNEKIVEKKGGIGGLKKKLPELTPEQAQHILEEMKEIAKIPDGKAKFMRFQKLQDYVAEIVPTPLYHKIITVWKAGLLTGIKTSGLNIMANVHHLGTEVIKDIPATAVDKIVSVFTGKRTTTPTIKGIKGGMMESVPKTLDYIKTGYSERDIGTKLDYKKVSMGKGPLAKALQAYTNTVFRLLGAEDQPFYYAAKLRSLYEQAKVSAMNQGLTGKEAQAHVDKLMEMPTTQMIKNATKDAEVAVFINHTTLGDIAGGIQQLPGGEIVVPFGRTPSAVAMQVINYSPVGIAKTVIENIGKGRFDQREFSKGIGRGITGTSMLVIGAELFKAGLISLDRPTSEKERKLWELEGRQPNSVKIGNDWRTVQSFGPAGNLLIIGGHFQRAFDESGSPTEAMATALAGSAKSFTEQTFLRGVNQFVGALADPERSAPSVIGNTLSSVIPTITSDIARATDIRERRADTIDEKMLVRIPGARQTLEPQVNVLGEERKPTANPLELMIDPTRPSKEISTPVIKELRRLWDEGWEVSPSLLGDKAGYTSLTKEENTELWKSAGTLTKDLLDTLVSNSLYQEIPDEKKAEYIGKLITEAQTAAKTMMVAKKLQVLKGKELVDILFDLRQSGLASQAIIPIALSKQNPKKAQKTKK